MHWRDESAFEADLRSALALDAAEQIFLARLDLAGQWRRAAQPTPLPAYLTWLPAAALALLVVAWLFITPLAGQVAGGALGLVATVVVRAAIDTFRGHDLPEIKAVRATNIPQVLEWLGRVTEDAERLGQHVLVLLTGTPGSGKTLVGLQAVMDEADRRFETLEQRRNGEPPRLSWRLRSLRGWSHDESHEVSARAA